jgi:hypothetical protein
MISAIALTLEFIGTILVAYAALKVHHRFLSEHKVDEKVFNSMKRERRLGVLGVVLVAIGYVLQVFF